MPGKTKNVFIIMQREWYLPSGTIFDVCGSHELAVSRINGQVAKNPPRDEPLDDVEFYDASYFYTIEEWEVNNKP